MSSGDTDADSCATAFMWWIMGVVFGFVFFMLLIVLEGLKL